MLIPKEKINQAKELYGEQAMLDIVSYFGLEDSYNEKDKSCSCPWHRDKTPSFIWNPKNNSAHCFSCNRNFGIIDLYLTQGMSYLEAVEKLFNNVKFEYNFNNKNIQDSSYRYPKHEHSDRTNVEKYMELRKISKKTLDYADVQSDCHGNVVFHYYNANDTLMTVKYRLGHKFDKEKDKSKCWAQSNADFTPLLFNMNRIDPSKPLVITEGECMKGDTEILTPEGWIRLDEYNNQQVMQVDSNMSGSFVTPLAYVKKQYSGNMVCVRKGGNYTFEATENHNMVYIKSNKEIIKRKACEMPKSIGSAYIPTAINYNGKGISLSNDQIALYLAVSADCTIDIRKGCRYSRFGVKKNRKYNRIKNLLDRLEIKYFDNPNAANGYKYIGFRTPNWIESKELPVNWIYDATLEQRKFILDEMVYWDGNRVPNRNQVEYSTKLYSNAILIQTIAHTCGYMSTIIKRKNLHGEWYKVSILFNKHGVSFQNGFDKEYYYEGMVYCVTVPTGMILIRQEGHVSVTGNCDTLSIIESGYSNVVSTPNGCGNTKWVEYNWDWLEQFDKIILWYDSDEPGIKGRNEVLYRLGTWRTYYIEIPPTETTENGGRIKDANELLYFKGKEKVLEYINKPFEIPVQNVMDLSKAEDFDIEHTEGLYTGIKELDDKIYKLTFGTLNIITGRAGSGKSCFVNQVALCQALQQGYDTFVFSGELPAPILRNWIETTMIGRDNITMKDGHIRIFDSAKRKQMQNWYSGRILVYDNDRDSTANSILNKMEELARKCGTKVFLIDNLMMVDLECNEEGRLQAEKNFIGKLINFAKKYNVLVFLVAHPRKTKEAGGRLTQEDIAGSGNIVNLAHMVFSVHRYTEKEKQGETNMKGDFIKGKEPIEYDISIEVLKNRITGVLPTVDMYFDYNSYRFYRTPSELWFRYNWNKDTSPLRTDDPNIHKIEEKSSPF